MKVMVTGASGYIGSHVCKQLKEHGHTVYGFDLNIHNEHNDVEKYCDKFWVQDLMDHWLMGWGDAVVHLAGRSVVPQSLKEPSAYYRTNIMGTKNAVEKLRTENFIFASTSSAFEMASPYARSKVGAEDVIKEKADGYTIFRFFNVSGTDGVNRQLGVASHLIRVAAMVAAGKLPNVKVFGNDYDTRDGTCIRDYIHVSDLSSSIVKAVETGPSNTPYECLGSQSGWTVHEVLDTMEKVTGVSMNREIVGRRLGDQAAAVATPSTLCNLTKTLEDMCLDQYNLEMSNQ
jgi:UDP-glucose 4-epimerase